jgi:hypothetical protein
MATLVRPTFGRFDADFFRHHRAGAKRRDPVIHLHERGWIAGSSPGPSPAMTTEPITGAQHLRSFHLDPGPEQRIFVI